jgi:hypothetical protein
MIWQPDELHQSILLHLMAALLDNIGPHVRGVRVNWDARAISIEAFVEEGFDEDEREGLELACTEMMAAFSEDFDVTLDVVRVDPPTRLDLYAPGKWVYRRQELAPPDDDDASSPGGPYR